MRSTVTRRSNRRISATEPSIPPRFSKSPRTEVRTGAQPTPNDPTRNERSSHAVRELGQRPADRVLPRRPHRRLRDRRRLRVARLQARARPPRRRVLPVRGRRARLHDLPPRLDRLPLRAHDRRSARPRCVRARVRECRLLRRAAARPRGDALVSLRRFLLSGLAVLAAALVAAGCAATGPSEPVATTKVTMVNSYRSNPEKIEI